MVLRVRPGIACTVHPSTGIGVVLVAGKEFDDDDPVVSEFAWAFGSDVEDASANPGSKRNVRRQ